MKLDKSIGEQGVKATGARCCVFILGMHRSGTSALSRTLSLLGCDLPNAQITATDGNEAGHWEPAGIVALNDALLASAGSCWNDWLPVNPRWYDSPVHAGFLARARETLAAEYAGSPLFVLKDPRNCRLARFWYEAFEAEGIDPVTVISLRNPLEVAKSLEVRDEMEPGYGELLWLRHMLDAEQMSRHKRRCVVEYGQLLSDWSVPMGRLQRETGLTLPRFSPMVDVEIGAFLSGKLRHHDLGRKSVLDSPLISDWLKRTYEIFTRWSTDGEDHADHAVLDGIRAEFDGSAAAFARLVMPDSRSGEAGEGLRRTREAQAQQEANQREHAALRGELDAAREELTHLAQQRAALEAKLAETTLAAGQIDGLRSNLDALQRKAAQIADVRAALEMTLQKRGLELDQANARRAEMAEELAKANAAVDAARQVQSQTERDNHVLRAERDGLADRVAVGESALRQRQEENQQTWAELAKAQAEAEQHRAEAERLTQRLDASDEALKTLRVALGVSEVRVEDSKSALEGAEARAVDMELRLTRQQQETVRLGELLRKAEAEAGVTRAARERAETRLDERFDEIAQMTRLLAAQEKIADTSSQRAEWLQSVSAAMLAFPRWWALLPKARQARLQRERLSRKGLFDAAEYLRLNPDVADSGMDPLRHYLLHGLGEGRPA